MMTGTKCIATNGSQIQSYCKCYSVMDDENRNRNKRNYIKFDCVVIY